MSKYKKATAQKSISIDAIRNVIVPICSPQEQVRIVAGIDELMAKIDEYEKIEKELVELHKAFPGNMKDAILQAAMQGKLTEQSEKETQTFFDKSINLDEYEFEVSDNWSVVTINKVCEMYAGNSIPEHVKKEKYAGKIEGLDYIGTKDVQFDHTLTYDNGVRIPFDEKGF